MTNLLDDVRASFHSMHEVADKKAVSVGGAIAAVEITEGAEEIVPGFYAMRMYSVDRIKVMLRRGYRHFAGAPLPESSDEAFEITKEIITTMITALVIDAYCAGVQVGHNTSHLVQMRAFYQKWGELFTDADFRETTSLMAIQFSTDEPVRDFFSEYVLKATTMLSHDTGFAHQSGMSHKLWDLWMLSSTSVVTSGYIAGHVLGVSRRERDLMTALEKQIEGEDE